MSEQRHSCASMARCRGGQHACSGRAEKFLGMQEALHHVQLRAGLMAAALCVTTLLSIAAAVYARIMSRRVRFSSEHQLFSQSALEA